MKNNEVLEELFAAEEAAMGSLHPTEEAVRELIDKLAEFKASVQTESGETAAKITACKEDLAKRITIAEDLYEDLEPAQRESETGKQLQDTVDALKTLLRGITNVADALADLKLIYEE